LSASTIQIEITAPVLTLVEAKNADTKLGLGQCAAQMVAAQRFNQERGIDFAIWGACYRSRIIKSRILFSFHSNGIVRTLSDVGVHLVLTWPEIVRIN
jgi:hypothetical protein